MPRDKGGRVSLMRQDAGTLFAGSPSGSTMLVRKSRHGVPLAGGSMNAAQEILTKEKRS
jgi:hypothetical protein